MKEKITIKKTRGSKTVIRAVKKGKNLVGKIKRMGKVRNNTDHIIFKTLAVGKEKIYNKELLQT